MDSNVLERERGITRVETDEISAENIARLAGPPEISIGDTFSKREDPNKAHKPLEIEESTLSIFPPVINGSFSGQDGKAIMLRQLKERLERGLRVNATLLMEDTGVKFVVPRKMTFGQAMEWIRDDELVEVTPKCIRIRKTILDIDDRKHAEKKQLSPGDTSKDSRKRLYV